MGDYSPWLQLSLFEKNSELKFDKTTYEILTIILKIETHRNYVT